MDLSSITSNPIFNLFGIPRQSNTFIPIDGNYICTNHTITDSEVNLIHTSKTYNLLEHKKYISSIMDYIINLIQIDDIQIFAPEFRVICVTFVDGTKIRCICDKSDTFNLEYGVYLAISKYLYSDYLTLDGVIEHVEHLKQLKSVKKVVDKAINAYHRKEKEKERLKQQEQELKDLIRRKRERNKRRREKRKINNN